MTLLKIENLHTYYNTEDGKIKAAEDIDIELASNETLGLVGESGSGKTTVAKSIIRLLPDNAEIAEGSITYKNIDIMTLSSRELRKQIRWNKISMIPQNAMNGFDPVYTVGEQIVEVIEVHEPKTSEAEAWERTRELFDKLGLDQERVDDYPHQFSGGMAQRAMIAIALAVNPSIVLADEPTTALDVIIQDRILQVIQDLQDEFNTAIIMITHDMSVVSETCDKIGVMYGGRLVEYADSDTIIKDPRHPYTLGLRNAFPDITDDSDELISIPGTPPDLVDPEEGCRFAPRCPFAEKECWEVTPEAQEFDNGHVVECHRADEAEFLREEATKKETWEGLRDETTYSKVGGSKSD